MINILAAKRLTQNPADGIDNFTRAVFGRMKGDSLLFYAETEEKISESGALRRLSVSRMDFLRREKPDILWGIGRLSELPLLLRRSRKTKYLINFHTLLHKKSVGAWSVRTPWFLRKFIFNRADLVICPSEFSAESVRCYFPKKRVVSILNGVDLNFFNPRRKNDFPALCKKYNIETARQIVSFVGALQSRKRPEIFIELAAKFPEVQFIAVGRRDPAHEILSGARELANFQWIERMPREDVAALLAASKLFVFPSLNEPSAAVILEAMASGCIPVLSKSGGNGEFLSGADDGFLVPCDGEEIDAFATALQSVLRDDALTEKMSRAARSIAENHSLDIVAQRYEEEIQSVFK